VTDHIIETEQTAEPEDGPSTETGADSSSQSGPVTEPGAAQNGSIDTDTGSGQATNGDSPAPQTRAERREAKESAETAAAPKARGRHSGFRRAADLTGRILIGAGIILLLFTAYQIWGTSIQESHAQNQLRKQLTSEAHHKAVVHALDSASAQNTVPTGPPVTAPHTEAPPEGSPVGEIRIPVIGLNQVLVEGTGTNDLRQGPGHYVNTPLPGQGGNAAIAGHRTTYGHPFYNLDGVKPGDPIVVTTLQGVFVYDAFKQVVVSPSDTTVIDNVFANYLTLTTCNPRFSASSRLVVVAKLAHSELFKDSGLRTVTTPHHAPQAENLAGDSGVSVGTAFVWGFFAVLVGGLVLYLGHRFRRYRWPVWVVGTLGVLVLLYAFFGAVSPLLPASF
jgi:sortase A